MAVETTPWWAYVQKISGGATQREIATKIEVDQSAVSRWRIGGLPQAPFAVRFARGYGVSVLDALVAAGIITEEEAAQR